MLTYGAGRSHHIICWHRYVYDLYGCINGLIAWLMCLHMYVCMIGYHAPWSEVYEGVLDRPATSVAGRHKDQQFEYVRLRWPINSVGKWLHQFSDHHIIWIITLSLADIDVIVDFDDQLVGGHAGTASARGDTKTHGSGDGDGDDSAPPAPPPAPPMTSSDIEWQRTRFTRQLEYAAELCQSRWCNGSVVVALTKTDVFASKILARGVAPVHVSYPDWAVPPMAPQPSGGHSKGHGDYNLVNMAFRHVYHRVHQRFSYLYHGNSVRKLMYHITLPADHAYWLQQKNDLIAPFTDQTPIPVELGNYP